MRLALALAVSTFGVLAPAAGASIPARSDPAIAEFVRLAETMWPDSPCWGVATVDYVAALERDGQPLDGLADTGDCSFKVNSALIGASGLCSLVVHEMGHLAGLEHSDDPTDVMYITSPEPGPCDDIPPRVAKRRSFDTSVAAAPQLTRALAVESGSYEFPGQTIRCRGAARKISCTVNGWQTYSVRLRAGIVSWHWVSTRLS